MTKVWESNVKQTNKGKSKSASSRSYKVNWLSMKNSKCLKSTK